MARLKKMFAELLGEAFENMPRESISWLFQPGGHTPIVSRRRASIILSRVRIIAVLFGLLTLLWIPIDFFTLPLATAFQFTLLRIVTGGLFLVLGFAFPYTKRLTKAYAAVVILFAIPTAFYLLSLNLLNQAEATAATSVMNNAYIFFPIIIVAGIGIFPLTIVEALAFAAPVFIANGMGMLFEIESLGLVDQVGAIWLMMLIALVSGFASVSQVAFMTNLIGQAMHDSLTRCFSRLSIEELLELQFIIAERNHSPLTVAFLDLDNFKSINDKFGHKAGDTVLANVVALIQESIRHGNMIGRWGGEEFIIIFPNTTIEQASMAVERLRRKGLGMRPDGTTVTASIGLAEKIKDKADNWKDLVEKADHRMYIAKHGGKDRVMASES